MSTKVSAAALAAMAGTLGFWLLATYAHTDVPQVVQTAAIGLLAALLGYVNREQNPSDSMVAAARRKGLL